MPELVEDSEVPQAARTPATHSSSGVVYRAQTAVELGDIAVVWALRTVILFSIPPSCISATVTCFLPICNVCVVVLVCGDWSVLCVQDIAAQVIAAGQLRKATIFLGQPL